MFYRCVKRILTTFATPANEALPSAVVHLMRGVPVAARIILIAVSENPLSWRARPSASKLSTGESPSRCGRARPCWAGIMTGDPVCVGAGGESRTPSGGVDGTRISSANSYWGDDNDLLHLIFPDLDQSLLKKRDRGTGEDRQPCP